jgi:hypothetical protein
MYLQQYIDDHQFIAPSIIILGQKIASALEKNLKSPSPLLSANTLIHTYRLLKHI